MNSRLFLTAALAGVACLPASVSEPVLVVARLAADGTCEVCPRDAGELPCGLASDVELLTAIGHQDCMVSDACIFEAGWDEALLVAVPGTADAFDGYLTAARSVTVTTVLDGAQSVTASAAGFASAEADGTCSFVYSAPQRKLAADAEGTIRWVVADDGDDLSLYSKTYDVSPPGVCTSITTSSDPVIAGVTLVTVTADVPANYPLEKLQVAQLVNGIEFAVAAFTAAEAVVTDTGKRVTKRFIAPAQPFARYRVEVRGLGPSTVAAPVCGEPATTAVEFDLDEPAPLMLALVAGTTPDVDIDFGQPPVRRIAAETDPECRDLKLGIKAAGLPKSSSLTISTDFGSLDNTGRMIARPLPDTGTLVVPYRLPTTPPDASEVHFSAMFGAASRGDLTLVFERVHAVDWKPLSTTSPTVQVGSTGSAPVSLKGRLFAPAGTQFLAGTRVDVHVEPTADGVPAKCQPALATPVIKCDPSMQGGGGGCALTDTSVAVAPDGSFTIDLAEGACFIGQLKVVAHSMAYDPGQQGCLGERTATKRETSEIVLDFVDAP